MVAEVLIIAAAVFGPLAHGCVEPWSVALLEILLFCLLLGGGHGSSDGPPHAGNTLVASAAAIAALGALQRLNPAPVDGPAGWLPFTASSHETGKALVLWCAYIALLARAPSALSRHGAKARYAWALVIVASVVAAVGAVQLKDGNMFVYGLRKATYGISPFGPYFQRGHAASFMAMVLPLGLGLFAWRQSRKWRFLEEGMSPSDFIASQAVLALLLAFVMAGIALARNRGAVLGLAASALATGLWACGYIRSKPLAWLLRSLLLLVPAALGAFILSHPTASGFTAGFQENSVSYRAEMYRGAWRLLRDFPLWGVGLGAIVGAFPPYKHTDVLGVVDHVHSDWLELPLQTGIAGSLALAAGLLALGVSFWRRSRKRRPQDRLLEAGALAGALAFIAHAAVEFSFETPANAVVFLSLLCWLAAGDPREAPATEQDEDPSRHPRAKPWFAVRRWALTASVLGLMGCAVHPVVGNWYLWRAQGLPIPRQIPLLRQSYRWSPEPQTAFRLGYCFLTTADKDPRGRAPALREGLTVVQRALLAEPLSPYLTRLQGSFLIALGRRQDAQPMLAMPK